MHCAYCRRELDHHDQKECRTCGATVSPQQYCQTVMGKLASGAVTVNEVRAELGLIPLGLFDAGHEVQITAC